MLAKAVDASACAARVGGDEFTVLLPGMDERSAVAVRERIASLVEINNQFYPGQHLSLAMGLASCAAGDQVEAALHHADQAMYAENSTITRKRSERRRGGSFRG